MPHRIQSPMALVASAAFMYLPIPLVIATRPPKAIRLLFFVSQLLVANWATTTLKASDDTFATNVLGCMLYGMPPFMAIDFYFLTDPLTNGTRHLYDKQAAKDMPFLKRLWWSTCFFASLRGVGWNKPVPHLRQIPKDQTRASFLIEHTFWLGVYLLVSDFANLYFSYNPITSSRYAEGFPITSQGPLFQALNSFIFWSNAWAGFNMVYEACALLGVGMGFWEPQFWPPMFGNIWDAYTVRRTWGRFWHCILRRFVASQGKWVAQVIGAKPGTKASSYSQLYTAFFISGIIHEAGARMLDTTFGSCTRFFMLQALWITLEDGVIGLGKRLGVKESAATRALGGLVTFVWFAATTPVMLGVMTDIGGKLHSPAYSGSIIETVWRVLGMEGRLEIPWPEPQPQYY